MATIPIDPNKRYTYADYLTWLDDKRRELIDGFVHLMTPAPASSHQDCVINLGAEFRNFLIGKTCKVYVAPFDVRLPKIASSAKDDEIYTVVQPDLCIVCDLSKVDERGCLGAPELVVEVLSPTSTKRDTGTKFKLYESAGVQEYWLVYPHEKAVNVFHLQQGHYQLSGLYASSDQIAVSVLPNCSIDLHRVFEL